MRYRLLAADLDGTLVTDDKRITDRTKRAVNALTDRGGILVLASGRPTHGVWHVARDLGLDRKGGYILSYNGGELLDCVTGRVLFWRYRRSGSGKSWSFPGSTGRRS